MPISFRCGQCGRRLKAPDHAAGKTSKCPECGAMVTCPEPVYEAEVVEPEAPDVPEILDDDIPEILDDDPAPGAAPALEPEPEPPRRPCPVCGERILTTAVKCRFCGEVLDEGLRSAEARGRGGPLTLPGEYRDDYNPSALDWLILSLSCTGLGCFATLALAIVYMAQGRPKGLKLLAALGVYFIALVGLAILIAVIREAVLGAD